MRIVLCVLLAGSLLLSADRSQGREWVSRDGRYTVEAELLTVDGEQAVLRREDGSVIRVPLDRLSLSDVKYVQEAVQAAGMGTPPTGPGEATVPEPPQTASESSPEPPLRQQARPGDPPLAQPGQARWQAAPDPPDPGFGLQPDAYVAIPVPVRYSRPFVLFTSSPSPFVLLGSDRSRGVRQLWDMRTGEVVGSIDAEIGENDAKALSPDGRYLAYHTHARVGSLLLWSFAEGKIVQSVVLPGDYPNVMYVQFAGPDRLVVGESRQNAYLVYDVPSGEQSGTIDVKPEHGDANRAMSPGGNYLAVHSLHDQQLAIYDTRNGVRAGRLSSEIETYVQPEAMVFSPDGRELAASFRRNGGLLIQVWDLATGERVLTHQSPEDPRQTLGYVRYHGSELQWLADRSGWLLMGIAIVDRESGDIIWREKRANPSDEVLPRRIVDANRMLKFQKTQNEQTLSLAPIPKDEIAQSRQLVAAGGTAADAGLPPVTQVDMQDARQVTLSPGPWSYRPAAQPGPLLRNRIRLGDGAFDYNRASFSRPDVARLAIGKREDRSTAAWKALSPLPQQCHLYDLQSGDRLAQFDVPFPTEFLDLSPDGQLGLFCNDRTKDRLDIWDLTDGRHLVGFRPLEGVDGRDRQIAWAGFLDKGRVATMTEQGRVVVWKIPECRAVYATGANFGRIAGLTRDRRTMAVLRQGAPYLVDALSGETIGALTEVKSDEILALPRAAFSADEERLAVLFALREGCVLSAWDLTDGSLLLQMELPFNTFGLVWCGSQYVLLNRGSGSDDPDAMIDIERGLVAWKYGTVSGACLRSSPDDRAWFLCRSHLAGPGELAALDLPDTEVASLLSRVRMPDPLIGPGATVSVQTQIENPPQAIPPGWASLEKLDEGLYQYFSKELQDRRVTVVGRSGVRLVVGITQKKLEETMSVRGLLGPSRKFLVSATMLIPYVAVVDSSGSRVWTKQPRSSEIQPIDLDDCPEGMDKETYMKLQQWEQAAAWLRSIEIPYPLFHPSVNRGFGESIVTPEGTKIRRSPSPSQLKHRDKTA